MTVPVAQFFNQTHRLGLEVAFNDHLAQLDDLHLLPDLGAQSPCCFHLASMLLGTSFL